MLFNSVPFVVFFPLVFVLYSFLSHRAQNRLLLLASLLFYGWWDWRFLSLLFGSIALDFWCGRRIFGSSDPGKKKTFLTLSLAGNLGILCLFKYFNFFCESFVAFLTLFDPDVDFKPFAIILPLGVSFYTFQSMSYTIDIYRGEIKPTRSFSDFALYVLFFPQLVAGPIERATNLLPQLLSARRLNRTRIREGCSLILSGYFKKMVIADNLAVVVERTFDSPDIMMLSGADILVGIYAFAFQIYGDFCGYTDIARGLGKLLGFEITLNFRRPYFATNPSDFWKRWHISLSRWLRDYLYIPLGGNRRGSLLTYRNLAITMVLGGLWHGAAVHFILWGAYCGLILVLHRLLETAIKPWSPGFRGKTSVIFHVASVVFMFHLTCLGWVIFRADSFGTLAALLVQLVTAFDRGIIAREHLARLVYFVFFFLLYEIVEEIENRGRNTGDPVVWWLRIPFYAYMLAMLITHGVIQGARFIYFQF